MTILGGSATSLALGNNPHEVGDVPTWNGSGWDMLHNAYDVRSYGAVGDGSTDDTDAIDAAWSAAKDSGVLYFPAGNFVYNGTGLDGSEPKIAGAGIGKTTITLGASSRFLNITGQINYLHVEGIEFSGGIDVIRSTYTGTNVTNAIHVVRNCRFVNYTGAAISHNSSDFPWWKIEHCTFAGANYTSTIGIALSGFTDECDIVGCSFLTNRVHVKLGLGGCNAHIDNCDFLRYGATEGSPRVDVWVVPNTTAVNSGSGLVISNSKFGNEFLDAGDYRIVYADEGSGSDFGSKFPNLAADSTGFVSGHRVVDCFAVMTQPPMPFIYSTTPNVVGCNYGPLAVYGDMTYFIQFRTAPTADRVTASNIFGPVHGLDLGSENVPGPAISNGHGLGYLIDPNSMLDTRTAMPLSHPGGGDTADYVKLLPVGIRSFSVSSTTLANVADVFGGTDAAEITWSAAGGIAYSQLTMGSVTVGRPVWIEFDVKVGSSSPLTAVRVSLLTEGGGYHFRRTLDIPSGWRRVRFLHFPRTASGQTDLLFETNGSETGKVQIGRVKVYHAREPVNVDGAVLDLQHRGTLLGFYGTAPIAQPAANADTSGATLVQLETEVNQLKALLRSLGLMAA